MPADAEITDTELSKHALRDQDSALSEQLSRIYEELQKPDNNINTFLHKLVRNSLHKYTELLAGTYRLKESLL